MTTNLRDKINLLTNMIQAEDLQEFQASLLIDAAGKTTGDVAVDAAMTANATNAKANKLACARRRQHYEEVLAELNKELAG